MSQVSTTEELQQYLNAKNYSYYLKKVNATLQTLKQTQQWELLIECALNKANVFLMMNNKLAATQVLTEYRLLVANFGTIFQKISYYNLLASAHEGLVQCDKVFAYLKKARQLAEQHKANALLSLIYHNISVYYYEQQQMADSMAYAEKSMALATDHTAEYAQMSTIHYARLLLEQLQLTEAGQLLQPLEQVFAKQPITSETIFFWKVQGMYLAKQDGALAGYMFLKTKLSRIAEHSKWCEELYEDICQLSKGCNSEIVYIQDLKDCLTVKNSVLTLQNSEQLQLLETYFDDTNLKRLAWTDTLTQIPNRRYLEEIYSQMKTPFAAFILDIDSFKKINDSEGHLIGDEVLKLVVKALSSVLNKYPAQFVRLGGDEFFGIIEAPACTTFEAIAEQMVLAVRAIQLEIEQRFVCPTISLGVCYVQQQLELEQVMKMADDALYEAKARGKNQYAVFNEVCP